MIPSAEVLQLLTQHLKSRGLEAYSKQLAISIDSSKKLWQLVIKLPIQAGVNPKLMKPDFLDFISVVEAIFQVTVADPDDDDALSCELVLTTDRNDNLLWQCTIPIANVDAIQSIKPMAARAAGMKPPIKHQAITQTTQQVIPPVKRDQANTKPLRFRRRRTIQKPVGSIQPNHQTALPAVAKTYPYVSQPITQDMSDQFKQNYLQLRERVAGILNYFLVSLWQIEIE